MIVNTKVHMIRKDWSRFSLAYVLMFGAFFSDAFLWQNIIWGLDFRGIYVILVLVCVVSITARRFVLLPREIVTINGVLLLWSIFPIIKHPFVAPVVLGQLAGAMGMGWLAYYFLSDVDGFRPLAERYLKIVQFLAAFVLIDQILYLLAGIEFVRMIFGVIPARSFDGYVVHGLYRASGLLYEPSQVGLLVAPAVFFWLYMRRFWSALLGCLAILASFSFLGFMGFFFAFVLSRRSLFKSIVVAVCLFVLTLLLSSVPIFEARVGAFIDLGQEVLSGETISAESLSAKRGTTATLVANSVIASFGAGGAPSFGWGLGSFRVFYSEFLEDLLPGASQLSGFYNPGGGSLLIRMIFELGFLGTLLVFLVFWFRIRTVSKLGLFCDRWRLAWVLASVCFFLLCILRKDMFVSFYFWFFLMAFVQATRRALKFRIRGVASVPFCSENYSPTHNNR